MADQFVIGPTLRGGVHARRDEYLTRLTRWERTKTTGEGVVQVRRRFAGSTDVPSEAPFETDERRAIDKRYEDKITSYGDWEALRIIRNELNLNRMVAWLVWLKEQSATDPKVVESARNPFRAELGEGEAPWFGVLPPTIFLPAIESAVGFGGVIRGLRSCGAGLSGTTLATVFQVMAGTPIAKVKPSGFTQTSDEESSVLPIERVAADFDEAVKAFEKTQAPAKPAFIEPGLEKKIARALTEGRPDQAALFASGRTFAELPEAREAVDAAWGDAADRILSELSVNLTPGTIGELIDWLTKVYAAVKAAPAGAEREPRPRSGWEPPTRAGWEPAPVGGWEPPPVTGWDTPPVTGWEPPRVAPDRKVPWTRAVRAIEAIAALEAMNRQPLALAIQELAKLVLITLGWPEGLVLEAVRQAASRQGLPLRAAAMLEYPGLYMKHMHATPGFEFPPYTPIGVRWCANVLVPSTIGHILALKDTADFHTTDHLRLVFLFDRGLLMTDPEVLPREIRGFFEEALVRFKYWIEDEHSKASEEMTFWSENHQILFASCEYLAGQRWPDREFHHADGGGATHNGAWHRDRARARVVRWLDERLKFGFSEWNAPGYYNEDLPPLFNLVDFCDDAQIVAMALSVTDLIVFDLARFTCQGNFAVSAGRVYLEHKRVAWDQSIGDFIELLFGTRGDILTPNETTAIAFATSSYRNQVPEALIAIGRDRSGIFTDDSRVSIAMEERHGWRIGTDSPGDIVFWWGNGGYFTPETWDATVKWAEEWHLMETGPFKALILTGEEVWERFGYALLGGGASVLVLAIGSVMPFPVNMLFTAVSVPGVIRGALDILLAGIDLVLEFAEDVWDGVVELFGGDTDDDDAPRLSRPAVLEAFKRLVIEFNSGSLLTAARLRTFRTPDVMLSSAVNHRPGEFAFQKQTSIAVVGQNVAVWTTKPMGEASTSAGLRRGVVNAALSTPKQWLFTMSFPWANRPYDGLAEVALPFIKDSFLDPKSHDGPNWWTGTVSLPAVWQVDNVAIAMYKPTDMQRTMSKNVTHAWFPKHAFDEIRWEPSAGGTWVIGRRDRRTVPENPRNPADPPISDDNRNRKVKEEDVKADSGYVALFSANGFSWAGGDFADRELDAEGHANIFVTIVGDRAMFGSFDAFVKAVVGCNLSADVDDMECSLRVPSGRGPVGSGKHLDAKWESARVDGVWLDMYQWPRFENVFVHGRRAGRVDWGERRWRIAFPDPRGRQPALEVLHDWEHPERRSFNRQLHAVRTRV